MKNKSYKKKNKVQKIKLILIVNYDINNFFCINIFYNIMEGISDKELRKIYTNYQKEFYMDHVTNKKDLSKIQKKKQIKKLKNKN